MSGLAASDSAVSDLLGAWRQFLDRLRGESVWERWELWAHDAHPHPAQGGLTIAVAGADRIERLARPGVLDVLSLAAGAPVALVACAGAPAGLLGEVGHA